MNKNTDFPYHLFVKAMGLTNNFPDSKVHGANIWLTWVLSAPGQPHVGPMNIAIIQGSNINNPLFSATSSLYVTYANYILTHWPLGDFNDILDE